ncbi:low molecular weight phosphatase family protein [Microbacterium sp. UMB0228]|uniref:arsenate reductase/protein-tyrosine-phosphatase family protein n=1 Tax=Microbacterium sp. UMB0228 TaxID=2029109 RepID=UPI000C80516D|nr:low molecular weight phosphatase family protein [Microbacterium sp. UMB0228]PMC06587.1 low molecular weight phosphatase family protein [Microbacterium sp. UMB0228]
MFEITTICTGNICRSPLAEQLLRAGLADLPGTITSAGTRSLAGAGMPEEAIALATRYGVAHDVATAHRSRQLTASLLETPDLILAMSREHRRSVVELAPARLRAAFTLREFARLAADASDTELREAASHHADPSSKLRAAVGVVAGRRGMAPPPLSAEDDDIVDPYRRSLATYERSAGQLVPAVSQVVRVVRLAVAER